MYASSPIRVSVAALLLLGATAPALAQAPAKVKVTPPEATPDAPSESAVQLPQKTEVETSPQTATEPTPAADEPAATEKPPAAEPAPQNEGEAAEMYAVALGHYSSSRWQSAAEEFSRFLQQYPDHPQAASALFFRGEATVQQGLYAQARKDFVDFTAREPNHRYVPQARFRTAEADYLTGDPATARRELERFVKDYPDESLNAHAKTYLAELALSEKDGVRAAALFKEVLERHPDGSRVDQCRFGLGRASELQGDIDAARIAYQTLAAAGGPLADEAQVQLGICLYNHARYTEAVTAFQSALERIADNNLLAQAHYWLGLSQVALHEWDKAATTLQTALEQHPQHALAPAMLFWRAEACRHSGDVTSAQKGYELVLANWPENQWADDSLLVQVQLALAQGQYERVVSRAEQFQKQFPDSPLRAAVEQCLGQGYLKLKRYGQAIELLKGLVVSASAPPVATAPGTSDADARAATGSPENAISLPAIQYYLALAYLGDAQYEAALEVLAKADVSPENKELEGGIRLAHALALTKLNRCAEAAGLLQKYLATKPAGNDATACRLQLIDILVQDKRLNEALKVHAQITGRDTAQPGYGEATHRLAEAALAAGKYDAASGLFGLLTQDGQPWEVADKGWAGMGVANFRAGKLEAAVAAFGQLVERFPKSPLASKGAMMKAKALEQMGRSEPAVEAYRLVAAAYGDTPEAAPALLEAARIQEKLGRKTEQVLLLRCIIQEHPEFPQRDGVLYQLAWLLSDQGQADEASRLFEQISDEHRDSAYWADATYRAAQHAATAKQYERAAQLADRLTQAECTPEIRAHALFLQGQLAGSTHRWEAVFAPLDELLKKFPDSVLCPAAKYWTAEAYFQQKDFEKASRAFAELDPDKLPAEETWNVMVFLRRAQILAEQQKWKEAYDLASGIEGRFPNFPQQYEVDCLLGRCLAQQRKFADAVPYYERVVRSPQGGRTETAAMAQWLIGEAFAAQLDLDSALKAYYRVDTLFDYPAWRAAALVQAGKCHELKGENTNAANAWGLVVEKYPNTKYAAEAAEWLKRLNARVSAQAAAKRNSTSGVDVGLTGATSPVGRAAGPAGSGIKVSDHATGPVPGSAPSGSPRSARRRTISQP